MPGTWKTTAAFNQWTDSEGLGDRTETGEQTVKIQATDSGGLTTVDEGTVSVIQELSLEM